MERLEKLPDGREPTRSVAAIIGNVPGSEVDIAAGTSPRSPGQFSTHPDPSRSEVAAALEDRGLSAVYEPKLTG